MLYKCNILLYYYYYCYYIIIIITIIVIIIIIIIVIIIITIIIIFITIIVIIMIIIIIIIIIIITIIIIIIIITWVGAQNLKKPADSSDWRQKLWKSRQATAIMWRHNTVVHDYSGTRYSGTIPITGPYENPPFSYYINPIKCSWI